MSQSAVVMMVLGLGAIWGGALVTIMIALKTDKKNAQGNQGAN